MKKVSMIMSAIALAMSILAICIATYRTPTLSFDYMGVLVGMLCLITALLLAWQVFNVINQKEIVSHIINEKIANREDVLMKFFLMRSARSGIVLKDYNGAAMDLRDLLKVGKHSKSDVSGYIDAIIWLLTEGGEKMDLNCLLWLKMAVDENLPSGELKAGIIEQINELMKLLQNDKKNRCDKQ